MSDNFNPEEKDKDCPAKKEDIQENNPQKEEQNGKPEEGITLMDYLQQDTHDLFKMIYSEEQGKKLKCTYEKGYISQEIFCCLTCQNEINKPVMVCTACAINCHKDHELANLYFKRGFRCDCGNANSITQCLFEKNKEYENKDNPYNHNFQEKYCYCDKDEDDEGMIQCLICEDWFHKRCLNIYENYANDILSENEENNGEMICKNCFKKISFLFDNYDIKKILLLNRGKSNTEEKIIGFSQKENEDELFMNVGKRKNTEIERKEIGKCKKDPLQKEKNKEILSEIKEKEIYINAAEFEKSLCKCEECIKEYKEKNLEFLGTAFYGEWTQRMLFDTEMEEGFNKSKKNIFGEIEEMDIEKEMKKNLTALPVEKQVKLNIVFNNFMEAFKEFTKTKMENGEAVITKEMIEGFLKEFQKRLEDDYNK